MGAKINAPNQKKKKKIFNLKCIKKFEKVKNW